MALYDSYDDPNYSFSDPTSSDQSSTPPAASPYLPVPNSPGMYYDPSTGAVYGNPGGMNAPIDGQYYPVPGATYDPGTGQLSTGGQTFNPNKNYDPNGPTATTINSPNASWQTGTSTPTPTPTPSGGGGVGSTLGNLIAPINMPFQAPTPQALPQIPTLNLPTFTPPPAWQQPSWQSVQANDPGYEFRLNQGLGALTNSAAGQGLLRSGGTLKDFINYGQDYATNEYQTGVANSLQQYNTNYQTQYVDPYQFATQKAEAEYQPLELQWQTQAANIANQNALDWTHAFDVWNTNLDLAKWNQTWPYTVLSDQQNKGLQAASGT